MTGTAAPETSETRGYLRDGVLLRVEDMECVFKTSSGPVRAVDGVSFDVLSGETLALVGESGCGKTTTGRAILQLPGPTGGKVRFGGRDLTALSKRELRRVRQQLQMIFQDPVSTFNPRRKIPDIVAEGLTIAGVAKGTIAERVRDVLTEVGMSYDVVSGRRPHEFSGGQNQRIAIARALALQPQLIVCDEPVASLDVSVQAQVLNVLHDVKERNDLSLLFISHDLAVVRNISDRVAVMYLGKIVEIGAADRVYTRAAHPYTRRLLDAVPTLDAPGQPASVPQGVCDGASVERTQVPLEAIAGGCRFRGRCPRAQDICAVEEPQLVQLGPDHHAACHFPIEAPVPAVDANV